MTDEKKGLSEGDILAAELLNSLSGILAFYEPGQRYLDTVAWEHTHARAVHTYNKAIDFTGSERRKIRSDKGQTIYER